MSKLLNHIEKNKQYIKKIGYQNIYKDNRLYFRNNEKFVLYCPFEYNEFTSYYTCCLKSISYLTFINTWKIPNQTHLGYPSEYSSKSTFEEAKNNVGAKTTQYIKEKDCIIAKFYIEHYVFIKNNEGFYTHDSKLNTVIEPIYIWISFEEYKKLIYKIRDYIDTSCQFWYENGVELPTDYKILKDYHRKKIDYDKKALKCSGLYDHPDNIKEAIIKFSIGSIPTLIVWFLGSFITGAFWIGIFVFFAYVISFWAFYHYFEVKHERICELENLDNYINTLEGFKKIVYNYAIENMTQPDASTASGHLD